MAKTFFGKPFLLPLALALASWQFTATATAQTVIISPDGSAYSSVSASSVINGSYTPNHLFDQNPTVGAEISTSGSDAGFAWAGNAGVTPLYVEFQLDKVYSVQALYYAQRDFNNGHNPARDKIGTIAVWASTTTPFSAADPGTPPDATVSITDISDDRYLEYALSSVVTGRYFVLRFTAAAGSDVPGSAFGGTELRLATGRPLDVDFNSDSEGPFSPTQRGFYGVDVAAGGASVNATFNVVDTNTAPTGTATLSLTATVSRDRPATPSNSGSFTYSDLYRDLIGLTGGATIALGGLAPNTLFDVTFYSYDNANGDNPADNTDTFTNTTGGASGPSKSVTYGHNGGGFVSRNNQYAVSLRVSSDASGTLSFTATSVGPQGGPVLNGLQVAPATCATAPPGMIGWWRADGNGSDSEDSHTATLNGATFATGKVGQAFNLNGTTQDVRVPHTPSLDPTTEYSWDAWVYWRGVTLNGSSHEAIVVKTANNVGGDDSYSMFIYTAGGDNSLYNILDGQTYTSAPGTVPPNTWFHVAQTYDGTTARAYINGNEVSSMTGPAA